MERYDSVITRYEILALGVKKIEKQNKTKETIDTICIDLTNKIGDSLLLVNVALVSKKHKNE